MINHFSPFLNDITDSTDSSAAWIVAVQIIIDTSEMIHRFTFLNLTNEYGECNNSVWFAKKIFRLVKVQNSWQLWLVTPKPSKPLHTCKCWLGLVSMCRIIQNSSRSSKHAEWCSQTYIFLDIFGLDSFVRVVCRIQSPKHQPAGRERTHNMKLIICITHTIINMLNNHYKPFTNISCKPGNKQTAEMFLSL